MVAVEETDRELLHKDKYPSLISYHGKCFYRSGGTVRTITGKGLDKAIAFFKSGQYHRIRDYGALQGFGHKTDNRIGFVTKLEQSPFEQNLQAIME